MSKEGIREISIASREKLNSIIEYARRLHGHLGPFLVLGIKMSLAGMNKLGIGENMQSMRVEAKLPRRIPYTCTLDGIQATTQCTFGNQLVLKEADSLSISAKFSLSNPKKQVTISLKNEILQNLIEELREAKDESTQEKLAWIIASTPEEKLFSIKIQ